MWGNVGKIVTKNGVQKIPFNLFATITSYSLTQTLQNLSLFCSSRENERIRSRVTDAIQKNLFLWLFVAVGALFCLLVDE